jgi:nucleotide-binding universal stress UspA family protein
VKNAILVPLDGTVQAEQALAVAVAVAQRTRAELHPVLVHLTDYYRDLFASTKDIPSAERVLELRETEYLASIGEELASSGVKVHAPVVLHGDVAEAVAEHALHTRTQGVVMTTHPRGVLERILVPNLAQGLRRRLSVPMIFVRTDAEVSTAQTSARAAAMDVVLVALDGSADAEAALGEAVEIAGESAKYVLLRVVSLPPQLSSLYLPQSTILYHQDEEKLRAEAADYLSAVEERLRGRLRHVEKRLGVHSRPGHLIVHAAGEVGANLVAVGSHGHGALRETLFGSVTNDVVRDCPVPVLVTRPQH